MKLRALGLAVLLPAAAAQCAPAVSQQQSPGDCHVHIYITSTEADCGQVPDNGNREYRVITRWNLVSGAQVMTFGQWRDSRPTSPPSTSTWPQDWAQVAAVWVDFR